MSEPPWLARARALVGLSEIVGSKHEPAVVAFFAEAGVPEIRDDETAWCGAFVAAMFSAAGRPEIRPPGDRYNALRAREWLNVGMAVAIPKAGDIAVFSRGGKSTAAGHVAFFLREDGDGVEVLGGNQSNRVSIARYARDRLLGYRRVMPAAVQVDRPVPRGEVPQRQPDDPGPDADARPMRPLPNTGGPEAGAAAGALAAGAAAAAGLWWLAALAGAAAVLFLTRRLWWRLIFGERH